MKPEVRADLHRRTLEALNGTRPEGRAAPGEVPVDRYLDRGRADRERALMRRRPQAVAASSELPAAGAWLARDRLGVPLLLVRQEDGALRAFLNVCRHRGARLLDEGAGHSARTFVCPYHAWTYALDGSLKGLPQAFGFPCLNKAESGLRRLAVRERGGLVWVVADPDLADSDIDSHLDPLMGELEALDLSAPVAYAPRHYEVAANWKLLVDGSLEAYHFKVAHRNTIAHLFTDNLQIIDEAGLNRRLYLVKSNLDPANPPDADGFEPRRHGNILYFFFPNTTVLVQPDHAQFSTLEPLGPNRTRVHEITLLPAAPDSDKAERYWQANVDLYRRTLAEDYNLSESIQKGLPSGANQVLTFGTFEYSAPRFHRQLEAELDAAGRAP
ncbi:MAG TPA: (2Fe-2S)-binding protein [Alcanivorax sp.]|jgi:phenylpropionate dioxygenase-like ring-hydroxylating dioxygenase large terminal subunit|uniref:aromatic ring-hydroxylating oxygenase subunit alpha n=1 Tax=Alloalcanivorax venustensis TaxID=172371 RepID=UPI000C51F66D|nr:(2Fe-2S)-binding protein [Alcanivorax sp.]MBF48737.1 (2Fe-2S)-binding protein [Alcanivorax sp.]MBT76220.1 (2Fe-2S)-binding protein [Alcanivorax sp.]HAD46697.1 (2Fe-2S)-binding protein [Alcanivorax sp.]HAI35529.1 (2Fe-2S)-binding protein [Alcanivorax sp.]|tara:strand:- start:3615 stop:4769 length:1155 start_codon:yes stop_codon:yes gene_type:complete